MPTHIPYFRGPLCDGVMCTGPVHGSSAVVLRQEHGECEKSRVPHYDRDRDPDPGALCIEISADLCGDSRSADIYDRQRTQENQVSFHGSGGTCSTLCDLTIARSMM